MGSRSEPASVGGEWAEEGELPSLRVLWGLGVKAAPAPSRQASFLITNALRFMLSAPGVTSWQYTLLQLQVTPSSLCCPPSRWPRPSCSLAVPPLLPLPPSCPRQLSCPLPQPCPPPGAGRPSSALSAVPALQVNGVLPILPLLFPVLWVLATACGEARVLAQMSRGSPSSLVGLPEAAGPGKRNQDRNCRRSGRCPGNRGRSGSEALPTPKASRPGPGRGVPGSRHTGGLGCLGPPLAQMLGACWCGAPPASVETRVGRCPP